LVIAHARRNIDGDVEMEILGSPDRYGSQVIAPSSPRSSQPKRWLFQIRGVPKIEVVEDDSSDHFEVWDALLELVQMPSQVSIAYTTYSFKVNDAPDASLLEVATEQISSRDPNLLRCIRDSLPGIFAVEFERN